MNTNLAKSGELATTRKSSSGFSCPQFPMGCPAIQHRPSSRHRWRWHSLKARLRLQKMVAVGKIVEGFSLVLWYCTSSCGELPRTSVITPRTPLTVRPPVCWNPSSHVVVFVSHFCLTLEFPVSWLLPYRTLSLWWHFPLKGLYCPSFNESMNRSRKALKMYNKDKIQAFKAPHWGVFTIGLGHWTHWTGSWFKPRIHWHEKLSSK